MRTYFIPEITTRLQENLYVKLNKFSQKNKTSGRLLSIPVSILDVAIDTLRTPLSTIEFVAMLAINTIGASFSKEYELKDSLICIEFALCSFVETPIKLAVAPLKIFFQFFAIIIDPTKVQSINFLKPTFSNK